MANKWVYMFDEGNMTMRNLLGGKGANLAEMTEIGLPVPQIDQRKGVVLCLLGTNRIEAQGVVIEFQAPLQIQNVKIEMIERKHVEFLPISPINISPL